MYVPTAREELVCYLLTLIDTLTDIRARLAIRKQIERLQAA